MSSLVYTSNSTPTEVAIGSAVPVGYVTRKAGCGYTVGGNSIYINSAGDYLVDFAATITAGAAGNVKFSIQQNGQTIASSTESIATANTQYHSTAIPAVVKVFCCAGATVSVIVDSASTTAPTIQTSSLRIVKE